MSTLLNLTETLPLLGAAVAVGVSALAVAVSIVTIWRRANAEREYVQIVRSSGEGTRIRALYEHMQRHGKLQEDELKQLSDELARLADQLQRDERRLIREALLQHSVIGRKRYVDKVIHEAEAMA
jgi:predicted LPLAT superfamily acyltransferase